MDLNDVEILLVEDSPEDAEMTIRTLRKKNLANKLVHVEDGAAALDFLFNRGEYAGRTGHGRPKLILLDIKMPKIDGIEVLRQVKANEATKMIPVVMMTSSNEDKDIVASYQFGVNSYVVKPVNFDDFSKAIGELGLYWLITNRGID
ncbi:MAG: response regulator [Chitinophagaceae bacterium]|nr:response regulator [Chitinophagaceae bacterium]